MRTAISRTDPKRVADEGFTLLELLVVLTILALVLGLAVPRIGGSQRDAQRASWEIAAALRQSRADAVRERRQTEFAIDLDAREFKFGGDAQTAKLFDSLDVRLRTAQFDEESEADGRVRFYPDGSSSGGRVILHDGQNTYAIGVEWLNGRVKIAEADWSESR